MTNAMQELQHEEHIYAATRGQHEIKTFGPHASRFEMMLQQSPLALPSCSHLGSNGTFLSGLSFNGLPSATFQGGSSRSVRD